MTISKEEAKKLSTLMAEKRKEFRESTKATQKLVKENNAVRKTLKRTLKPGPHTIPQIAEESGMPSAEVVWHIAAMLKYGDVIEDGVDEDEEYYTYSLAKKVRS